MSDILHRSSFKNSQIYIAPVHKHVKMPLINTLHHFNEREFIPLAAAAAASFAVGRKQKTHNQLDTLHGLICSISMETEAGI